jgi:carotenoid cleavage dioxygenase-like enzyme
VAGTFVRGFSSVAETGSVEVPVRGSLPDWLSGVLLRNGPGCFEAGRQRLRHWFDGFSLLHRFALRQGKVSYSSRFLHSTGYLKARQTGQLGYREFATDPCGSIFGRLFSSFRPQYSHNANGNIACLEGRFWALAETPLPVEFHPQTLETLGGVAFADRLGGHLSTTHPHFDYQRQELINYAVQMGSRSAYLVYRLPAGASQRQLVAALPTSQPAYMHSFALTSRHIILAEFPFVVQPASLPFSGRPFIENYRWEPGLGTRFTVLRRQDGTVAARLKGEPFFAFHHLNAYESGDEIFLDVCAYPDTSILGDFYLERLRAPGGGNITRSEVRRYHLPLRGGEVRAELLCGQPLEFPCIHYRLRNGLTYRYAYGVGLRGQPADFYNELVKLDVQARAVKTWYEEDCYPGEPVFVPAPGARGDDDGVVLSVVFNGLRKTSFLLVLDGTAFYELARAELPVPVPFGFHGHFYGEESLASGGPEP